MPAVNIREKFRSLSAALYWFDRAYLVDWIIVLVLYFADKAIDQALPVYERSFSLTDPSISYPVARPERVSSSMATFLANGVTSVVIVVGGGLSLSLMEIHHGCLSVFVASTLMKAIVEFLKNRIGRLRPDFLDRCQWDLVSQACTGVPSEIKDGRRSFPSGHSATAFSGLGLLFLYLAGKSGCFCRGPVKGGFLSSRVLRAVLSLSPLVLASWIAVTRLEDHRHHNEDVIAGSLIGMTFAVVAYTMYFYNPFGAHHGLPKLVYAAEATETGYVLSAAEEDMNDTV